MPASPQPASPACNCACCGDASAPARSGPPAPGARPPLSQWRARASAHLPPHATDSEWPAPGPLSGNGLALTRPASSRPGGAVRATPAAHVAARAAALSAPRLRKPAWRGRRPSVGAPLTGRVTPGGPRPVPSSRSPSESSDGLRVGTIDSHQAKSTATKQTNALTRIMRGGPHDSLNTVVPSRLTRYSGVDEHYRESRRSCHTRRRPIRRPARATSSSAAA